MKESNANDAAQSGFCWNMDDIEFTKRQWGVLIGFHMR